MPTGDEYQQALTEIAELIEDTGDTILDDIDTQDDDGNETDGFVANHGSLNYAILLQPHREFGRIQFDYSISGEFVKQAALNSIDGESEDEQEVEVTDEMKEEAGRNFNEWVQSIDEETAGKLRYKTIELLSDPNVGYNLQQTDSGLVHGFTVSRKIYPYSDGFDMREVGRSVQAVISVGNHAQQFMQRATGWETTTSDTQEQSLSGESPRTDRTFH